MDAKHTFVVLPFTPELLADPSPILPIIYRAALHSLSSCTVILSTPDSPQLYAQLRREPQRHWHDFQTFLGKIYAALAGGQWRAGRVLMDVEVRFDAEAGEWGDKLAYASVAGDKRLVVTERHETLPALGRIRPFLSEFATYVHPFPTATSWADDINPTDLMKTTAGEAQKHGPFPVVALGGTFDHLHAAHKLLLHLALFLTSRKLIVGLMADSLLSSKNGAELIEPLPRRIARVQDFLRRCTGSEIELDVVEIQDPFGPTAWDADIQCLVVSKETLSGGRAVNAKRQEKGLGQLEVFVIDVIASDMDEVLARDSGEGDVVTKDLRGETDEGKLKEMKMGSTAIRQWIRDHGDQA